MVRRIYPGMVTLMGGVGLGLALTYFVGVVLAFVPGWEDWAEFFVPRALYLVLVPYVFLIAHLVLRNHAGRFLLQRGAFDEAVEYARARLEASLLRSRREIANHRLVCARALVGLGDYDEARELLSGQHHDLPGTYAVEARRWQMELALRRDDRDCAESLAVDDPGDEKSARGELAALLACEAELALREGNQKRYRERIEDAMWERSGHPRVALCRALAMVEYEDVDETGDEVLELIELAQEPVAGEVPARRSELLALRALVSWRRDRGEEARALLDEARQGPGDPWTDRVVDEVAKTIDVEA